MSASQARRSKLSQLVTVSLDAPEILKRLHCVIVSNDDAASATTATAENKSNTCAEGNTTQLVCQVIGDPRKYIYMNSTTTVVPG